MNFVIDDNKVARERELAAERKRIALMPPYLRNIMVTEGSQYDLISASAGDASDIQKGAFNGRNRSIQLIQQEMAADYSRDRKATIARMQSAKPKRKLFKPSMPLAQNTITSSTG